MRQAFVLQGEGGVGGSGQQASHRLFTITWEIKSFFGQKTKIFIESRSPL
jgi:hypothetical protein